MSCDVIVSIAFIVLSMKMYICNHYFFQTERGEERPLEISIVNPEL